MYNVVVLPCIHMDLGGNALIIYFLIVWFSILNVKQNYLNLTLQISVFLNYFGRDVFFVYNVFTYNGNNIRGQFNNVCGFGVTST